MSALFGVGSDREKDDLAAQELDQLETVEELRQLAAEDLAAEFGTDVSEWLV